MNTSRSFKTVYISHPYRGDMDRNKISVTKLIDNLSKVDWICKRVVETYPDVLPLSPLNAFSFFKAFADDDKALEMDMKLLELADELWVFGEWEKSEGCRMEIERARELSIPISYGKEGIK